VNYINQIVASVFTCESI